MDIKVHYCGNNLTFISNVRRAQSNRAPTFDWRQVGIFNLRKFINNIISETN